MFTVKLYSQNGFYERILEAQSFTVLHREDFTHEITLHQKNPPDDTCYEIKESPIKGDCEVSSNVIYQRAIIENSNGRTTDIFIAGKLGGGKFLAPKNL